MTLPFFSIGAAAIITMPRSSLSRGLGRACGVSCSVRKALSASPSASLANSSRDSSTVPEASDPASALAMIGCEDR